MKKRMLCAALCLCLVCSLLVTPAVASHFCCSCDGDAYCDTCYEMMKHTCMFVDDYAICGKCFETVEHSCADTDGDYMCDFCFAGMEHTCEDVDGDYLCDLCYEVMDHSCEDTDGDSCCDLCYEVLEHICQDADGDYWCDFCDEWLEHDCTDDDGDGYCDLCNYPLRHECVDADGDYLCDICFDILIPDDLFTTVSGTAKSGLDDLEPVYIDIYDEEGTYINFAILTGDAPAYELMIFPHTSYNIQVSKEGHVTRTYTLDVADGPANLDVKLCPVGDVSGDGKLNMGDIAKLYSHIRNTMRLTDDYALGCADVSGDGNLNIGDTAALYSLVRTTVPQL